MLLSIARMYWSYSASPSFAIHGNFTYKRADLLYLGQPPRYELILHSSKKKQLTVASFESLITRICVLWIDGQLV